MLSALKGSSTSAQFRRYSVVGVSGFVIDFGTYALLTRCGHLHSLVANTISFSCAVVNNYVWHKRWTFRRETESLATTALGAEAGAGAATLSVPAKQSAPGMERQFGVFVFVSLVGLAMNSLILHTISNHAAVRGVFGSYSDYLGKAVAVPIVWVWNFGANKLWTFRKG